MPTIHCAFETPHRFRPKLPATRLVVAIGLALCAASVAAADFTITGADTTARTLGSASGQTGTVTATGVLTIGGGTVAVTVTGNGATLTNLGTISQTGTGRVVRDNTGVTNLTVNNGSTTNTTALMQASNGDVIQMNQPTASVTLNNYGRMISLNPSAGGSQAVDFSAITTGANVVNNYASGLMKASEADAVRPGANGVVYNAGTIQSVTKTGSSSDGIDLQGNAGVRIVNDATGLVEGGRHAITGGADNATVTYAVSIENRAGGRIQGDNGAGLNFDGFNGLQRVTVVNAGTITGNGVSGDGDGVDIDGLVTITNSGVIRSINAFSAASASVAYSEGVSAGGGTIVSSGTIEGLIATGNTNALGRGITLVGNDITTGPLAGTREGIYGNVVVDNQGGGVIRGQNDSAIVVGGPATGFTVAITNAAGATIAGGGTTAAAIVTAFDDDTVVNRGTIDGSRSGKAIDLGGGNNRLSIVGGQAFILGDVNGGTSGGTGGANVLAIDPGVGHRFAYTGSITNFDRVAIGAGTTELSGTSGYAGTTTVEQGGTLILNGAGRLAATSALDLAGGTLRLVGAAGVEGQRFASFALGADSAIDLGGSSLTFGALGTVADDALLMITGFFGTAPSDYAFRFVGDVTGSAAFRELLSNVTIDGHAARSSFDGTFTGIRAVPEPSTVLLTVFGLGLGLMSVRRRRPIAERFAAA